MIVEEGELATQIGALRKVLGSDAEDDAALYEFIRQHHLLNIIRAGGIGKTTVALHPTAARQGACVHGVWWVEMVTIRHNF